MLLSLIPESRVRILTESKAGKRAVAWLMRLCRRDFPVRIPRFFRKGKYPQKQKK